LLVGDVRRLSSQLLLMHEIPEKHRDQLEKRLTRFACSLWMLRRGFAFILEGGDGRGDVTIRTDGATEWKYVESPSIGQNATPPGRLGPRAPLRRALTNPPPAAGMTSTSNSISAATGPIGPARGQYNLSVRVSQSYHTRHTTKTELCQAADCLGVRTRSRGSSPSGGLYPSSAPGREYDMIA
jgi:hypothetical protein